MTIAPRFVQQGRQFGSGLYTVAMRQTYNKNWISQDVLDRFLRYVQIDTTSDQHIEEIPSTDGQWDLLRLLKTEL